MARSVNIILFRFHFFFQLFRTFHPVSGGAHVYLGSLAKAASGERTRSTGEWVLYGVGLLATVIVTIFVTRIAKQALAKKITQ